jgi:hypothetical protein
MSFVLFSLFSRKSSAEFTARAQGRPVAGKISFEGPFSFREAERAVSLQYPGARGIRFYNIRSVG